MPFVIQPSALDVPEFFGNNDFGNVLQSLISSLGLTKQSAGFYVDQPNGAFTTADNLTGNRLDIKYFSPDLNEEATAQFQAQEIMGRSSPIYMYSKGEAMKYKFICYFVA